MYQIGDIQYLKQDDPMLEDYDKAIEEAIKMCYDGAFIGVWTSQDEGSEALAIVHQHEVFEKR